MQAKERVKRHTADASQRNCVLSTHPGCANDVRNRCGSRWHNAETATAHSAAAAEEAAPRDATNATVTPDTSAAQTSDENDDNPLLDDVSDPDVDACLRVLDNIVKDPKAFGTPQHRKLRGAVRAAHGALTAGDFGGIGPVRKSTSE